MIQWNYFLWYADMQRNVPVLQGKKKKIFLALSTKKASQWVAKMTLTSEISLISAGSTSHWRSGSPALIPRHLAHLPSGSLPCWRPHSLLRGDREVKMLHLGWRTCSLGSTYGPQHHNSIFPNPCWITSQRQACKTCLALYKKKSTFPDCRNSITAKHNTKAKALQSNSVYPKLPRGQRNCKTLQDAVSFNYLTASKMQILSTYLCCNPSPTHFPTWEQYSIAVQFKNRVILWILRPQTLAGPGATPQHLRTEIQSLKRPLL